MASEAEKQELTVLLLVLKNEGLIVQAAAVMKWESMTTAVVCSYPDERGSQVGRAWDYNLIARSWLTGREISRFSSKPCWRKLFRVLLSSFEVLTNELSLHNFRKTTRYRPPNPATNKIAAFMMHSGGAICDAIATQIGIGVSGINA